MLLCRNESRSAQVVIWSLAVSSLLLVISLISFVGVLLAGNSLVSTGVSEGRTAVSLLLPEVARTRDQAVGSAVDMILGRYSTELSRMFETLG